MKESLAPRERIRKKKEFLFLYKKGSRYRGRYFSLIYLPNEFDFSRMGVVVSKKIGNAVERNKIKRWLRTLFRRNKDLLPTPVDLIIVAKRDSRDATWPEMREQYIMAVKSLYRKGQSC